MPIITIKVGSGNDPKEVKVDDAITLGELASQNNMNSGVITIDGSATKNSDMSKSLADLGVVSNAWVTTLTKSGGN